MRCARSMIRTGSPISSMNTSPPRRQGGGLQDELHRLRDAHEEAGHPGVRDRHRAAGLDLADEGRDDAAARAQHVAEADGAEVRAGAAGAQHELLPDGLGRAHHAARAHGLVGRDEDEALGAGHLRGVDEVLRAPDVGLHRLARVVLQQRDVLVRGGVEHDLRAVHGEHAVHQAALADVAEDLHGVAVPRSPPCRAGGSRRGRAAAARTATHWATWRAISEPIEPPAPVMRTRLPRRSAVTAARSVETCVRPSRSSMRRSRTSLRVTFPPTSSAGVGSTRIARPAVAAALRQQRDDLLRGVGDREHHLLHVLLRGDPRDVPERAEDLDAVDPPTELARVVVEQPHRRQAGQRVVQHVLHQRRARLAGAEDEDARAGRADDHAASVGEQPGLEAQEALQAGADRHRQHHDGGRDASVVDQGDGDEDTDGRGAGQDERPRLLDAGVRPDAAVQPEQRAGGDDDERGERQEQQQLDPLLRG